MLLNHDPLSFDQPQKSAAQGRVVVIQPDGSRTSVIAEEPASIQRVRHVLDCRNVELIQLPPHRSRNVQLLVDEEGGIKDLEFNPIASDFAGRFIVGIAVLLIGKACFQDTPD